MRRTKRYQRGYVQFDARTRSWYFRWRDEGRYRSTKIGTTAEFPTKSAAQRAADPIRAAINKEIEAASQEPVLNFNRVIDAYIADDLPERHSTRRGYLSKLKVHIRPRWGEVEILKVTPAEYEAWLKELHLASKSKEHLRSLMHILIDSAMRRGWMPLGVNPMTKVRIKGAIIAKRRRRGITVSQWQSLLHQLPGEPMRTMVVTCVCLGLRCSELFGLKWSDFDWEAKTVTIQRAVVEGRIGDVKTENSYDTLPVDDQLAERLHQWRQTTQFNSPDDWVFANPQSGGAMPYAGRSLQQNTLTPAAVRAGIGPVGWHALRHTYRSLLGDMSISMDVQKELMRHASITTTMDVYGSAVADSKRQAHSGVVKQLLN